ncbi:hypothetical protein J2T02_005676 [Chitinophaga terrae (ex Kim and Jung 2007)]|nr:hypothetical protein [Chitinophaga terrae (ex Kim and Jung 2007)]
MDRGNPNARGRKGEMIGLPFLKNRPKKILGKEFEIAIRG